MVLSTLASCLPAGDPKDVVLTAQLGEKTNEHALPAAPGVAVDGCGVRLLDWC